MRFTLCCLASLLAVHCACAKSIVLPVPNGGFEQGLTGWSIPPDEGMSTLSTEQAAAGKYSLKIVDDHPKNGSSVSASRVAISGAGAFELQGKVFPVSGSGLGLYVRAYDADGKLLGKGDEWQRGAPAAPTGQWIDFRVPVYTSKSARSLEVWFHSYSHARVTAYLDEIHLVDLGTEALKPPWEGEYKLHPQERERLTTADIVGPDGVVYPDWRYAGVPGGIPRVAVAAKLSTYGGMPDDGRDDSQALQRAVDAVGAKGGGAVLLDGGVYHLNWPVTIHHSGVVIRGAGQEKTRLVFRYALPKEGIRFFSPLPGSPVAPNSRVDLHAVPKDLQALEIQVDGQRVARRDRQAHWGNTFSLSASGRTLVGKFGPGQHVLTGLAMYPGGRQVKTAQTVAFTNEEDKQPQVLSSAALLFIGKGWAGPTIKLTEDAPRGATSVRVESTQGLAVGDPILIEAPKTERWDKLVRNVCRWGTYRRAWLQVTGIEGNTIHLNQPLRLPYPTVDGAYVQKVSVLRRCGVEDLSLEQTENLWINSLEFSFAWECWAQRVTVKMTGRFPCHAGHAKWCEIRDCVFDDAWFKGGGGTAYVGWQHTCDSLMENVTSYKMRHAPCVQWAASGNVIRKSTFHESDGQWHAGWTNENLFEQCVIDAKQGNGAYGYGFWASPPEDAAHGPNGPRNVVYNCAVHSPKSGLWMGGMNEGWLILYNRFIADRGPGIFAKTASFDHVIRGNTLALGEPNQSALLLATPDCAGVEFLDNHVYGEGASLFAGSVEPLVSRGNRVHPPTDSPPRPQPAVPSIFEWQRKNLPPVSVR